MGNGEVMRILADVTLSPKTESYFQVEGTVKCMGPNSTMLEYDITD